MGRRRLLVFAGASAAVVTLLVWMLLPYILPPAYHAVDITWEYRNRLFFYVSTDIVNVNDLLPSGISIPEDDNYVLFELGLLHVEVEEKGYDVVFLMLQTPPIPKGQIKVPQLPQEYAGTRTPVYVLGFFTNNSELGGVLRSYGFPHTYVEATYQRVDEGGVNRTRLTMTYPNGSLLVDISYVTSGKPELYEDRSGAYVPYENYCYLRNDNLTVLKLQRPTTYFYIYRPYPEGLEIWKLNMTMSEGTVIWRALGRHEYAMNIPISYTYPLYRMSGKMGWTEWR